MGYYVAVSEKTGRRCFLEASEFKPKKGRLVPKQQDPSDDPSERFRVIEVFEEFSRIAHIIDAINSFEQASDLSPGSTGIWDAFQEFADGLLDMTDAPGKKPKRKSRGE